MSYTLKKPKATFPVAKRYPESISKTLQVVHKHYGKKYTVGFNLQGEHLKHYGFEYGDKVEVFIEKNKISIQKIIESSDDEPEQQK